MEHMGTVLIVDDNPNNLQVLGDLLAQAGYKVKPALSGEIALRSIDVSPPDLALLDVRMPGIDGYETCRRMRANPRGRDIPVIFISAMQDTTDKLAGFEAGGVDYVAKPFQAEEILARVQTHIQLYRIKRELASMVEARTLALSRSEARYRVLFEDSPLAVMVYDVQNWHILAVNVACARILGYPKDALLGQSVGIAVEPSQREALRALSRNLTAHSDEAAFTGALKVQHADGHFLETQGIVQSIDYAEQAAQILMLQDFSELRQTQERMQQATKEHQLQLEKSIHYDRLTGLPNRTLLIEHMRQGIHQVQRTGRWMAVFYLDIDAFKLLNEKYGKETGDHLLINVAECLRGCLRGGDTLARIGGDDFVMLLLGRNSETEIDELLALVQARLQQPFVSDGATMTLSASVGVTVYPHDDADPDTLLRHAEQAMTQAKGERRGRSQRFDPERDKKARVHQELVDQMRAALANREFVLYYQPKVSLKTNAVVGAEALIRWKHPQRGLLPPGAFLPEIEGHAFMVELGSWVIAQALNQMAHWRAQGLDLAVSVNIAAQQLVQHDFMDRMRAFLAAAPGIGEGRLELEVLETSALEDIGYVAQIIQECRALGVGFSLDDFGTGYSSLTYLRRLSADTLKIDQTFVRGMLEDPEDHAIVAGVIGLANAFHRKVIAEGVETVAHGRALHALGCDLLQGYGVARPMPALDMPGWVETWPNVDWAALVGESAGTQQIKNEEGDMP